MPGNKNVGNQGVWRERELLLLRGKKNRTSDFHKKITKRVDCHNKKDNKKNEWNALLFPLSPVKLFISPFSIHLFMRLCCVLASYGCGGFFFVGKWGAFLV